MARFVPLLAREQVERLSEGAREVVEYRKSGLSLNHVQGCPLDCVYCIRHTYGLWDQRQPRALMSDAVNELVGHRYFPPHVTPVQVFNRDSTTPAWTGLPWPVQLAGEPAAVESVLRGVVMLAQQAPQLSEEELRSRLVALGGLVR